MEQGTTVTSFALTTPIYAISLIGHQKDKRISNKQIYVELFDLNVENETK